MADEDLKTETEDNDPSSTSGSCAVAAAPASTCLRNRSRKSRKVPAIFEDGSAGSGLNTAVAGGDTARGTALPVPSSAEESVEEGPSLARRRAKRKAEVSLTSRSRGRTQPLLSAPQSAGQIADAVVAMGFSREQVHSFGHPHTTVWTGSTEFNGISGGCDPGKTQSQAPCGNDSGKFDRKTYKQAAAPAVKEAQHREEKIWAA